MITPVETVTERAQRKKREIGLSDKERLCRHKEKRRLRRQNLKPRLMFAESGEGWELTIPASRRTNHSAAIWAGALATALALFFLGFTDDVIGRALVLALMCLPIVYMLVLTVSARRELVRFLVSKDGGFVLRGRRSRYLLHRGPRAECTVGLTYAQETGLGSVWLPGEYNRADLGEQDLVILKSFCNAAGVPITSKGATFTVPTADAADAHGLLDHDDYLRRKWGTWFIVVFCGGALAVAAWAQLAGSKDRGQNEPRGSANGGPP